VRELLLGQAFRTLVRSPVRWLVRRLELPGSARPPCPCAAGSSEQCFIFLFSTVSRIRPALFPLLLSRSLRLGRSFAPSAKRSGRCGDDDRTRSTRACGFRRKGAWDGGEPTSGSPESRRRAASLATSLGVAPARPVRRDFDLRSARRHERSAADPRPGGPVPAGSGDDRGAGKSGSHRRRPGHGRAANRERHRGRGSRAGGLGFAGSRGGWNLRGG